jgi:hypothetical protein
MQPTLPAAIATRNVAVLAGNVNAEQPVIIHPLHDLASLIDELC